MADRPILFSAPMVRALLDGRKTQTRRIMKVQPPLQEDFPHSVMGINRAVADGVKMYSLNDYDRLPKHPTKWDLDVSVGVFRDAGFPMVYDARFAVGDRLYVREEWSTHPSVDKLKPSLLGDGTPTYYRATYEWSPSDVIGAPFGRRRAGMHMPRWASRLTLTVTDVRVERLQDCSEADAIAEGLKHDIDADSHDEPTEFWKGADVLPWHRDPVEAYADLWDHINGAGAWDANPWVVAVSFDVRKGNIDA